MNQQEYKREIDSLAIGLTQTPMFIGVNFKVFFANVCFCILFCINAHTLLGIPLFIILHLIFARLSIKEPNFLYLHAKSFIKTPPILNRWYWGKINSYEPW